MRNITIKITCIIILVCMLMITLVCAVVYDSSDESPSQFENSEMENINPNLQEIQDGKWPGWLSSELYEQMHKSIVSVSMRDYVGSGIIWDKNDTQIVIVSNRHLLMDGVEGEVTFYNGIRVKGKVSGYSQQYDIGFISVSVDEIQNLCVDIKDLPVVQHPLNMGLDENSIIWTIGEEIVQIGYVQEKEVSYTGEMSEIQYMPLFNCEILEIDCYSKAGMSGGAVLDRGGMLLGMISGGDAIYSDSVREAKTTYAIPVRLIESEYMEISKQW